MQRRHVLFAVMCCLSLALFSPTLGSLVTLSQQDASYSHIAWIPLISTAVTIIDRRRIFRESQYSPRIGIGCLLVTITGYFAARFWLPSLLTVSVAAVIMAWISAFVLCYGMPSLKAAGFPALFLLLTIPAPASAVESVSRVLQACSAELSHGLFRILGMPVFRQGFIFSLPGVSVEVAAECGGIRSTTALVISGVLAGHVFLRSGWRKIVLVVVVAFVAVFKNAVRIVFISSMAAYVDAGFLDGPLHHRYGGTVFSLFALALIAPLLLILRKSEGRA